MWDSTGFNHFHPAEVRNNEHSPPVVITGIRRLNREMSFDRPVAEVETVTLSHRDAVVSIDFAALDYTAPEKNRYRYRLEGFEDEWVDVGGRRRATYTNLAAGDYTLRIQAANNDGVWNEDGAQLELRVEPAPWRTWWAYALYALLFGAVIQRLHARQLREQRRAAELERTNVSLELEIAERRRAEEKIRNLSQAVEQSPASVLIADRDGRIEYVNPKFEQVTGWSRNEVRDRELETLSSGYTSPEIYRRMWETVKAGGDWRGELHSRKRNGELFWEYASVSPIVDDSGQVTHLVAVNEDITERKEYEQELLRQSQFDHLTDLPTRGLALDRLDGALTRDLRDKKTLAVMFVDLDNFKMINDTLSHAAGDELLKQTAARLLDSVREDDTVARLGADEFLLVVTSLGNIQQAELAIARVLECFSKPFIVDGRELFITASVGITVAPDDGVEPLALLRNANAAMHKAKDNGRAGYQFFTPAMNQEADERMKIETELRGALDRGELDLHFQPVFDVRSGEVASAEALLRWDNRQLGSVSPTRFVPIAEETGLIQPIGDWVLRSACHEAAAWARLIGRPLRVAVNISSRQLAGDGLFRVTQAALAETGLPPSSLELEVTEGWLIEDVDDAASKLRALSDLGVQLAVDDFGTGYSSLSYLQRFSFDRLKIDRSFVQRLGDGSSEVLVTAILAMSRSLGLSVVGEGVETQEQLELLQSYDCPLVQGFHLGRPLPRKEFRALLADRASSGAEAAAGRPASDDGVRVH